MLQIGGGTILCFQHADLLKTSVVSKIQINWTNIDQVMALCAITWHSQGLTKMPVQYGKKKAWNSRFIN